MRLRGRFSGSIKKRNKNHVMKKIRLTYSTASLIAANLVPLSGVFMLGWDAAVIVLLYWLENIVVGIYNVIKMVVLKIYSRATILELIFFILFFCFHYGAFCAGHGILLVALFDIGTWTDGFMQHQSWRSLLQVIPTYFRRVPFSESALPVVFLFLSHGMSFVQNYLGKKEYGFLTEPMLMLRPYQRVVILHLVVIAAAVPVALLGSPVVLLCLLVVLKTGMDVFFHWREHRGISRRER